ncbi:MAG: hypothetical protein KW804_01910 [Candidatus Doudnabacteria bacterium]|nr:hypothetical protein [Candidatus Doudnabacteria bacterium]
MEGQMMNKAISWRYWLASIFVYLILLCMISPLNLGLGFGFDMPRNPFGLGFGWTPFLIGSAIFLSFLTNYYFNPSGGKKTIYIATFWVVLGLLPILYVLKAIYIDRNDSLDLGAVALPIFGGFIVGLVLILGLLAKYLASMFLLENNRYKNPLLILIFFVALLSGYYNYNNPSCWSKDELCQSRYAEVNLSGYCKEHYAADNYTGKFNQRNFDNCINNKGWIK